MTRRSLATGATTLLAAALPLALPAAAPAAQAAPASTTIRPGTAATCRVEASLPKHQMRGLWVASVVNIDWPSKPGLSPVQAQAELVAQLDLIVANHGNAVLLQVRPTADTFWPSRYEPWSRYLTGTQGQDPGWDPLGFAVTQAHRRGLELHAWMNPFRVAMDEAGTGLVATHPARLHPEWTVPYGGKLYYNPGLPQVRAHIEATMLEAVGTYDLDALHFDDYFYPYPVAGKVFDDAAAYATYGGGKSLADWRRANIDALIEETRAQVHAIRPGTQFGVSPFGVWRNAATDPAGSATTAGAQTYDDLYADTRRWLREGMVDYLLPQVYWSTTLAAASYRNVVDWWAREAAQSHDVNLYVGEAAYKVGANADPAWSDPRELVSHLDYDAQVNSSYAATRAAGPVIAGNVFYNATSARANKLDGMGLVVREHYRKPALTPTMPWLDADPPAAPIVTRSGGTLSILGPGDANQYVIYRVPTKAKDVRACDLADTRNVVAIVTGPAAGGSSTWTDPEVTGGFGRYTWLVSSVDRGSNESAAYVVR